MDTCYNIVNLKNMTLGERRQIKNTATYLYDSI